MVITVSRSAVDGGTSDYNLVIMGGEYGSIGNFMTTLRPFPLLGSLRTMDPLCLVTADWTMANPKPQPVLTFALHR